MGSHGLLVQLLLLGFISAWTHLGINIKRSPSRWGSPFRTFWHISFMFIPIMTHVRYVRPVAFEGSRVPFSLAFALNLWSEYLTFVQSCHVKRVAREGKTVGPERNVTLCTCWVWLPKPLLHSFLPGPSPGIQLSVLVLIILLFDFLENLEGKWLIVHFWWWFPGAWFLQTIWYSSAWDIQRRWCLRWGWCSCQRWSHGTRAIRAGRCARNPGLMGTLKPLGTRKNGYNHGSTNWIPGSRLPSHESIRTTWFSCEFSGGLALHDPVGRAIFATGTSATTTRSAAQHATIDWLPADSRGSWWSCVTQNEFVSKPVTRVSHTGPPNHPQITFKKTYKNNKFG